MLLSEKECDHKIYINNIMCSSIIKIAQLQYLHNNSTENIEIDARRGKESYHLTSFGTLLDVCHKLLLALLKL